MPLKLKIALKEEWHNLLIFVQGKEELKKDALKNLESRTSLSQPGEIHIGVFEETSTT